MKDILLNPQSVKYSYLILCHITTTPYYEKFSVKKY